MVQQSYTLYSTAKLLSKQTEKYVHRDYVEWVTKPYTMTNRKEEGIENSKRNILAAQKRKQVKDCETAI
ncbi:hypothetical protein KTH_25400 [Thermosporothrix hazakensis]|jgi:hypothetical protein|uniref:Uncharacterized protein n=1 Tax=Thermosporothrix sp. COM3 TaxID=2490863 RepID=A0A455SPZ7_9CHLR|nr:hypothetical protein KTC_42390 [Thermosporothrix sp. COM3]GCE47671.1 hypothetical protein KTH_25400 [Thermosporothrix hazakensis]